MLPVKVAKNQDVKKDRHKMQWNDDYVEIYLGSISTPNAPNDEKLAVLWHVNPSFRTQINGIFESKTWTTWRAEVKTCLETQVPAMLETRDMDIINVLVKHTDSPSIQAEILSIISRHHNLVELINDIYRAAPLDPYRVDFTDLVCKVLTSTTPKTKIASEHYLEICMTLEFIFLLNIPTISLTYHTADNFLENNTAVIHTMFTILGACMHVLRWIYESQYACTHKGISSVEMDIDNNDADIVDVQDNIQIYCVKMLNRGLSTLHCVAESGGMGGIVGIRQGLLVHMPHILDVARFSQYNKTKFDTTEMFSCVLDKSFGLYEHVFEDSMNLPETHTYLENSLRGAEESTLEYMFARQKRDVDTVEKQMNGYHGDPYMHSIFNMYKMRMSLDIAPVQMALRVLPSMIKYFHVFPLFTRTHVSILEFMCDLNTSPDATPHEIQHAILTGLCEKVDHMDVTDVLMQNRTTPRNNWYQTYPPYELNVDILLMNLISNSMDIRTRQNTVDISRLMQTRIFDLMVMKIQKWLNGRQTTQLTPSLTLVLKLLQTRPYHTGRGFVLVYVKGDFGMDRVAKHYIATQCFEVPSTEKTKYISKAAGQEMYALLANTVSGVKLSKVSRITIADVLQSIMYLNKCTPTDTALCLAILPLLIENTPNQTPEVGRYWMVSDTVPDDMAEVGMLSDNSSVAQAVQTNHLLKDSLARGVLYFSNEKWREFQLRQSLFVPSNSIVHQRGLCTGWAEIDGKYFQPVVHFTLHKSLCTVVYSVLEFLSVDAIEHVTPSIRENIRYVLVFIEAMLDEVMNVEPDSCVQRFIQVHLEILLLKQDLGMDVHALACHVLRRMVENLDIPKVALLPAPSQSLLNDETNTAREHHIAMLHGINFVLSDFATSKIPPHLFEIIGSMPQQTPQQCRMVLDASVVLTHIHLIKAEKFSISVHKHQIYRALKTARRNLGQCNTGYSQELVQALTSLSGCCEKSMLGFFGW